jgi:hypothetical protein
VGWNWHRERGIHTEEAGMGFNAGDANLYRYVGNDPTNLTDPSGLQAAERLKELDKLPVDWNVTPALNKTMLPVAGVHGQTFTAKNCLGKPGFDVTFEFKEAYVGSCAVKYPGIQDPIPAKGAYVRIGVKLVNPPVNYLVLKPVQAAANIQLYGDPQTGWAEYPLPWVNPFRQKLAGWGAQGPLPAQPSSGWLIDAQEGQKNPAFRYSVNDQQGGVQFADITMQEADVVSAGHVHVLCIIGWSPQTGDQPLAVVKWGYYVNAQGKEEMWPAKPEASPIVPAAFRDAMDRWNTDPNKLGVLPMKNLNYWKVQ